MLWSTELWGETLCVCMCVCVHMHVCAWMCVHVCVCMCVWACVCVCMCGWFSLIPSQLRFFCTLSAQIAFPPLSPSESRSLGVHLSLHLLPFMDPVVTWLCNYSTHIKTHLWGISLGLYAHGLHVDCEYEHTGEDRFFLSPFSFLMWLPTQSELPNQMPGGQVQLKPTDSMVQKPLLPLYL